MDVTAEGPDQASFRLNFPPVVPKVQHMVLGDVGEHNGRVGRNDQLD